MSERILLLGASGFAGGHLRAEAEAGGHEVIAAGRRPGAGIDLVCDLEDPATLAAAVSAGAPTMIANLAGAASVAESWADPGRTFRANALGTLHLLEAASAHAPDAHLLCISSADVYGTVPAAELPIAESVGLRPTSPYGASKAAMEALCGQYARARGLRIAIARAFNATGPGQSERFAASSFAKQIAEAERAGEAKLELSVGDLSLARDFSDVRDTVRGYRLILENRLTGPYNVCSGVARRLSELVAMLAARTELELVTQVDHARLRRDEPASVCGSFERLAAATGWRPERALEAALGDLLDDWRARIAR